MRSSLFKTLFSLILLILLLPGKISADTIFVSPLTGTFGVGDNFTVRIMVSSPRQAINALSGMLSFPIDKLQVTSVSKIGSVLSLWVQEPFFSNSRGNVTFEGVVPNPGFSESNGRVLAVNFRVVGTGPAEIRLTSGSLLANDGYGTNVLKNLGSANFNLEQKQVLPVTPPAITETSDDTGGKGDEGPAVLDLNKITSENSKEAPVTIELPTLRHITEGLIKFLSLAIPLLALIFFLIHTTKRGVGNIRRLKKNLRKDLHSIDRLVGKSYNLLRDDMTDIVHILERAGAKRRLTEEENTIVGRLKRNLSDTEKIIEDEIAHAEKDLDD